MSRYFHHSCAMLLGERPYSPNPNFNYTGSLCTYEKYWKHTNSTASYDIVSKFDSRDYNSYKGYIVNTQASGSLEIDDHNRRNIVWAAGKRTGLTFDNRNRLIVPADAVKVVLYWDQNKVHAFPTQSSGFNTGICEYCGKPLITP